MFHGMCRPKPPLCLLYQTATVGKQQPPSPPRDRFPLISLLMSPVISLTMSWKTAFPSSSVASTSLYLSPHVCFLWTLLSFCLVEAERSTCKAEETGFQEVLKSGLHPLLDPVHNFPLNACVLAVLPPTCAMEG